MIVQQGVNKVPSYLAPLTGMHKGFPEVSGKVIPGYIHDDPGCEKYISGKIGLFIGRYGVNPDKEGRHTYVTSTRLCPLLACFAWGQDYAIFSERAVYRDSEVESAKWEFSIPGSGSIVSGYYDCINAIITEPFTDPRGPLLLKWLDENMQRKAAGEKKAASIFDVVPRTKGSWLVDTENPS